MGNEPAEGSPVRGDLEGVTVLVTRPAGQSDALRQPLERLGARVILTPAIRFAEPADWAPADAALRAASSYRWAIFTSANGVDAVTRRLPALGLSWEIFGGVRLAAIGPATADALRGRGLEVDVLPEQYQAEGILEALSGVPVAGRRILLARAEKAREVLPDELRRKGALVDVVVVYRTLGCAPAPEALEALVRAGVDASIVVTFTSSSTVTHFLQALPPAATAGLRRASIAAIGPITAGELRRRGLVPGILPEEFTVPALVEAIRRRFAAAGGPLQPS